jgi:hypothetical protein
VHRSARSRGYRSIETQRLADDGFEVRERIKLLHGRRVGRASVQLDTELGLDRRLTAECEKRPGNCGATITEGRLHVKPGRRCRVHTSWFHGLQARMSVSLGSMISASMVFEQKTERRKRKGHSRDKISESPIRMLSGISAAIFELISKLSRSWPCTAAHPAFLRGPRTLTHWYYAQRAQQSSCPGSVQIRCVELYRKHDQEHESGELATKKGRRFPFTFFRE